MKTLIAWLLMASVAFAGTSVTFVWDPNPEIDLAGYRLYQGTESRVYAPEHVAEIPAGTETVTIEVEDGTYFWALTALDLDGNVSGYSPEVSKRVDTTPPGAPAGLSISITIKINVDGR